jgi:hypothetical protein
VSVLDTLPCVHERRALVRASVGGGKLWAQSKIKTVRQLVLRVDLHWQTMSALEHHCHSPLLPAVQSRQ